MKVLVADDHEVVRVGLKRILESEFSGVVFGEASDYQELMELFRSDLWDLIMLDMSMPGQSGLESLKEMKADKPGVPVLMVSFYPEELLAMRALKAGAAGFICKDSPPEELLSAVHTVLKGDTYVSSDLADMLEDALLEKRVLPLHHSLSDREFEVMGLIGSGIPVSTIAEVIDIDVKTVNTYRQRLLKKMGMKKNVEVMRYAAEHKLPKLHQCAAQPRARVS